MSELLRRVTGHFILTLCPLSAIRAIVIAQRSNSLLDIKLTLAAVFSVPCSLLSQIKTLLATNTPGSQTLLVEAEAASPLPPLSCRGKWQARGLKIAGNGRAGHWQ